MTKVNRAIAIVTFHLISVVFLFALWYLYGKFAPLLAFGAVIANRYAIDCWLSQYGISLKQI